MPSRTTSQTYRRGTDEFGRGLSFVDAIYGVAITLLIVAVDPPPAAAWASWDALVASGLVIKLGACALSFVVIARFWRINHRLMADVQGMSSGLITANVVAAGFIVLIPFTTDAMSEPDLASLALPTALYAANIALASLAQYAVRWTAQRDGLLQHPDLTPGARRRTTTAALATPAVFLASIAVAFAAGPTAARLSWLALLVVGPVVGRVSATPAAEQVPASRAITPEETP